MKVSNKFPGFYATFSKTKLIAMVLNLVPVEWLLLPAFVNNLLDGNKSALEMMF